MIYFILCTAGAYGIWICFQVIDEHRYVSLRVRTEPYLGRAKDSKSQILPAVFSDAGEKLHHWLGGSDADLQDQLRCAGQTRSQSAFRSEQVITACILCVFGALLAVGADIGGATVRGSSLVWIALVCAGAGFWIPQRRLRLAIKKRRKRMDSEFPVFVDCVCLGVVAGEGLRRAIEGTAKKVGGELIFEIGRELTKPSQTLADALHATSQRVRIPAFDRFIEAVLAAQERGLPLADTLRGLAEDVRDLRKQELIEEGGKKQVLMLIPVVALILPVAIAFALYPGIVAIRSLS